jgi:hypothetical protein
MNGWIGRARWFAVLFVVLAAIAWLSPPIERSTDRGVYETTSQLGIVPDCSELHCFRVLVPWVLGLVPGPSLVRWKTYAAAANAAAGLAVYDLALLLGATQAGARMGMVLSAFGFGSLYSLFDPYTADPFMYWIAPLITIELMRGRLARAGLVSTMAVFGKEFAAVPLTLFAALAAWRRDPPLALRTFAWATFVFLVWLAWQLTLIIRFNYSYGDNPSTDLLGGGYLAYWLGHESIRTAITAIFNEFGALYLLAAAGFVLASDTLRRLAAAALPIAAAFVYVQQPDRALWNFHFIIVPLSVLVLQRVPAILAWACVGCFAFANLKIGAQLPQVPASRYAMAASLVLAAAAVMLAGRRRSTELDLSTASASLT